MAPFTGHDEGEEYARRDFKGLCCVVLFFHHHPRGLRSEQQPPRPLPEDIRGARQHDEGPRVHEEHHLVRRGLTRRLQSVLEG